MQQGLQLVIDFWLNYNDLIHYSLASVSWILNILLIVLIITKSPKIIGNYKYLMIYIAIFEIAYSIFGLFVRPIGHSFKSRVILFETVKTDKFLDQILIAIYAGFYACSIALFAIHFFYRYTTVNKVGKCRYFEGKLLIFWIALPIFYTFLWSCCAYFIFPGDDDFNEVIRNEIYDTYHLDVDQIVYVGENLYFENISGQLKLDPVLVFGTILQFSMIGSSMFVVFWFGVKSFLRIRNSLNTLSENTRRLQNQFFNALVFQTLIPLVLMYIPITFAFTGALTLQNIGNSAGTVSIGMILYPAVEPLPTILIIPYYREAIREMFLCKTKVKILETRQSV